MAIVYQKPKALSDDVLHYCPGCTHGIIHKLVAEVIDELGIEGKTVGIAPVGCSVFAYNYFNCDMVEAAHGRAPAVATGLKRSMPDNVIFTYQGDGDLDAIGTAETVHSATRGENITIIFVNNAIYGMTGGQMAPTTLPNQVTQTTPYGRDVNTAGYPVRVCEMLAQSPQGQGCHQKGLPEPDRQEGLLHRRDPFHLPHQLGSGSCGRSAVAARQHDALLSFGRIQGQGG